MERKAKKVCESEAEQVQLVMANHLNGSGRLFGGQLAEWIDVLAGVVARRHCNSNITTASIDSLNFKEAVHLNELMVLHGKVTYVGNTSMLCGKQGRCPPTCQYSISDRGCFG